MKKEELLEEIYLKINNLLDLEFTKLLKEAETDKYTRHCMYELEGVVQKPVDSDYSIRLEFELFGQKNHCTFETKPFLLKYMDENNVRATYDLLSVTMKELLEYSNLTPELFIYEINNCLFLKMVDVITVYLDDNLSGIQTFKPELLYEQKYRELNPSFLFKQKTYFDYFIERHGTAEDFRLNLADCKSITQIEKVIREVVQSTQELDQKIQILNKIISVENLQNLIHKQDLKFLEGLNPQFYFDIEQRLNIFSKLQCAVCLKVTISERTYVFSTQDFVKNDFKYVNNLMTNWENYTIYEKQVTEQLVNFLEEILPLIKNTYCLSNIIY